MKPEHVKNNRTLCNHCFRQNKWGLQKTIHVGNSTAKAKQNKSEIPLFRRLGKNIL